MIIDNENLFSDNQDLAQAVGSYVSNGIDVGLASTPVLGGPLVHDVGRGRKIPLFCQVTEAFAAVGAGTLQVQIVKADNEALTTNLAVVAETPAIGKATLVKGYRFRLPEVPPGIDQQFLGLQYVIAGDDMTAGKVSAGIVSDVNTNYI